LPNFWDVYELYLNEIKIQRPESGIYNQQSNYLF